MEMDTCIHQTRGIAERHQFIKPPRLKPQCSTFIRFILFHFFFSFSFFYLLLAYQKLRSVSLRRKAGFDKYKILRVEFQISACCGRDLLIASVLLVAGLCGSA